jgi:hypothetical protein
MKLDAMEFIRRFMQHILPSGFYKIRYFGFLALCNMKTKLAACFALTDTEPPMPRFEGLPALDVWRTISGRDPLQCAKCKEGRMIPVTVQITAVPHDPG